MKELKARDIMVKDFTSISPDAPVREAARLIFEGKVRETGYKPAGIVVIDEINRLRGIISMFDILYHLRPPFMNYALETLDVWKGEIEPYIDQFKDIKVEQIMSSPVLTASPEDDLMVLIDWMIKKKARRVPVVDGEKILGIVYLSDVFYYVCKTWLKK